MRAGILLLLLTVPLVPGDASGAPPPLTVALAPISDEALHGCKARDLEKALRGGLARSKRYRFLPDAGDAHASLEILECSLVVALVFGLVERRADNVEDRGADAVNAAAERFGPLAAVDATADFSGSLLSGTFHAIGALPGRIPRLVDALRGRPRDPNSPVSVIGASRVGGQAVAAGSWLMLLLLLASFNVFVGVFNMFPLLPLDGGHAAIATYERVRERGGRRYFADVSRLMPFAMAVIVVLLALFMSGLYLDVTQPLR